jgi:two-component system cell cycle sensor histidine kinase/response regulator CckA
MIAVRDTGQGMTADLVSRVFEPFFTTKAVGSGTGLGLTMVYAFVKNCSGHIDVASEVGVGTTFRIYLPRAVRRRVETPSRPAVASPTRHDGATVLVIDDELMVVRSIQRPLERSGYRVLVAHTAEEALSIASARRADISLVILDMLLPGMSGVQLGRRLSEMQLPAKLLYISGFSPEGLSSDEVELESSSFLQKPFTPSDLLGRVGRLLEA